MFLKTVFFEECTRVLVSRVESRAIPPLLLSTLRGRTGVGSHGGASDAIGTMIDGGATGGGGHPNKGVRLTCLENALEITSARLLQANWSMRKSRRGTCHLACKWRGQFGRFDQFQRMCGLPRVLQELIATVWLHDPPTSTQDGPHYL